MPLDEENPSQSQIKDNSDCERSKELIWEISEVSELQINAEEEFAGHHSA